MRYSLLSVKMLNLFVLLLLVAVCENCSFAQKPSNIPTSSLSAAYQAGKQAFQSAQYENAVHCFQQVIVQKPQNINAHYYLALSLDRLGRASSAMAEYAYVTQNGYEANVTVYAQKRLLTLQGSLPKVTSSASLAMIASGSQSQSQKYQDSLHQVAVPLKGSQNALIVDALLSQGSARTDGAFIIDTGATYTSISEEMAEQLGLNLERCEKIRITTANGRIEVPKILIQKLSVNGLEAYNVEATVIPIRHGSSFSGLLGLSFIRQFVLTIDPQAGQLIFRRN